MAPSPFPPVEPPRTPWRLTLGAEVPGEDLVGLGADLAPGTLLEGYRHGLFAMEVDLGVSTALGWWSPDPRGVLELGDLVVHRSLRSAVRRFDVTVDLAFDAVVAACADPRRTGSWITDDYVAGYRALHDLGWAHSVEVWSGDALVGGLFGVLVGGLFAGESMFHHARDASKVALVGLVDVLSEGWDGGVGGQGVAGQGADRLIDTQWSTPHLASLGVRTWSRDDYLQRLAGLVGAPSPPVGPARLDGLADRAVRTGDRSQRPAQP